MKKSDKVYSEIINSENDAEYLKIGKDFIEDISYPGAPTADRTRCKLVKPVITKVKVKNRDALLDDEVGLTAEEIRIKRMEKLS